MHGSGRVSGQAGAWNVSGGLVAQVVEGATAEWPNFPQGTSRRR